MAKKKVMPSLEDMGSMQQSPAGPPMAGPGSGLPPQGFPPKPMAKPFPKKKIIPKKKGK